MFNSSTATESHDQQHTDPHPPQCSDLLSPRVTPALQISEIIRQYNRLDRITHMRATLPVTQELSRFQLQKTRTISLKGNEFGKDEGIDYRGFG